jgi:uncharacterized protein (TIGR03437 family)
MRATMALAAVVCLAALVANAPGQTTPQPVRWRAQYSQIYFDDIETQAPSLSPVFSLAAPAGSLTSVGAEVISGNESIRGAYSGTDSFAQFLQTNSSTLPLAPNHSYQVTFQYRILTPAANGFQAFLNSPMAQSQGIGGIAGASFTGAAGKEGTAVFTTTTGSFPDYAILWGINGAGAVSIDNIQLIDPATGKVIASENAEGVLPSLKSGLQLRGESTVVTDPAAVISGKASIQLGDRGSFMTDPSLVPVGAGTVYTVKFDYRILSRGSGDTLFNVYFSPAGNTDSQLFEYAPAMLKNQEQAGTFSAGVQTQGRAPYVLHLDLNPGVSLIVDNIGLYRQDVTVQNAAPAAWAQLLNLPFPRLGNYLNLTGNTTEALAQVGWNEKPFTYTVSQIENRLAFSDVIAGLSIADQNQSPDSIPRIRALNTGVVILPSKPLWTQSQQPACCASTNPNVQLQQSTPNEWKAFDTSGKLITDPSYAGQYFMNISDFVPAVNGQTWRTALPDFVKSQVFPSGLWDGLWMASVVDALDGGFPHASDPALFNFDWNRNGVRDETPASTSEMLRSAKRDMLRQIGSDGNGLQMLIGNTTRPQFTFAPLLNGFSFECFNTWWGSPPDRATTPGGWRVAFDGYLRMQSIERSPQINIIEGCGTSVGDLTNPNFLTSYIAPAAADYPKHRLSMGTALLGNGFYEYDLKDPLSAPYWFDEYSVDSTGKAVENRAAKGYLGHPLTDATELTSPGTLVFQEGFDSGTLPTYLSPFLPGAGTISVTKTAGEVISGSGSLVISNPDHSRSGQAGVTVKVPVVLKPGVNYLLTFDWRILETLDFPVGFGAGVAPTPGGTAPGSVAGDAGTLRLPFTIPSSGNWPYIGINGGGGKVAIDNIRIYEGGVGPWRRDFENGFVLVNPLSEPHTFSAADLAGALGRTSIRRIQGTQAPDVNNGQPVTGELTVNAYDAIILLADRIPVSTPVILGAATAGGAPNIAQNGWIAITGMNLVPPGTGPGVTWEKSPSFESALMPIELAGVRVTINGKPAFVYFASPNQINVLSPLDNTVGMVEIVVTSAGVSSAPFLASLQPAAPSFPQLAGTSYVVATHTDYSLVGPASLSSPGYPFTPAHRGEIVVLYAFGLGLPASPLVNGSSLQSGSLPNLPQVQIGDADANVLFAGVISPGLYQLNVTIPLNASTGDNRIVMTYNGQSTSAGNRIAVQ